MVGDFGLQHVQAAKFLVVLHSSPGLSRLWEGAFPPVEELNSEDHKDISKSLMRTGFSQTPTAPPPAEPHGMCPHQPCARACRLVSAVTGTNVQIEASCTKVWCTTQNIICQQVATPAMNVLSTSMRGTGKKVLSPSGLQQEREQRQCCRSQLRSRVYRDCRTLLNGVSIRRQIQISPAVLEA